MNKYNENNKPILIEGSMVTYPCLIFNTEDNTSFVREITGVDFEDAVQRESFYYRYEYKLDCKVTHSNVIEFANETYLVYSPIIKESWN